MNFSLKMFLVLVGCSFTTMATETDKEYPGIVAIINDEVITNADLDERVRVSLFSTGSKVSENTIKKDVLEEIVQEKLKKKCAEKYAPKGGWISDLYVEQVFSDIATRNGLDKLEFEKLLNKNGISKNVILSQILTNLEWGEYIKARYGKNINISDHTVKNILNDIREKRSLESYKVRRIFLPVNNNDDSVLRRANNMLIMIRNGASFEEMARQFSKGAEALRGGNLGWIFHGQLSLEENAVLEKMPIGTINIVRNNSGYVLLQLCDKRRGGEQSYTKLDIVQVMVPFSNQSPSPEEITHLKNFINDIKSLSRNCADFINKMKESGFCGVSDKINLVLEDIQPNLRSALINVGKGQISTPIHTREGLIVVCVLDRNVQSIKEPTSDDIKSQKSNEKLNMFSEQELSNLRKKADIKIFI